MEVSLADLPEFAREFIENLPERSSNKAFVVGLSGELGAGKTAFVKEVAKALNIPAEVTSPTFLIAKRYPIPNGSFGALVHADAYRLRSGEGDTFGWATYVEDPANIIFVEWPEMLPWGMPEGAEHLTFTVTGEKTRDVRHAG